MPLYLRYLWDNGINKPMLILAFLVVPLTLLEMYLEGLLLGLELVIDREQKTPFPPQWSVGKRIGSATLARGLVSYPGAGTYDGVIGDHLLYAPPLTITESQVDDLIAILDESLRVVRSDLARSC